MFHMYIALLANFTEMAAHFNIFNHLLIIAMASTQ